MPHIAHRAARFLVRSLPAPGGILTKIAGKIGGRPDEDVVASLKHGGEMLVNLKEYSGLHLYVRGHHQPYILRHFEEFLKPGMTMFDIGAHFGLFTINAGRLVGPAGHVHAFEPGPVQLKYLRANVEKNHFRERVTVNAVALGKAAGQIGYEPGPESNLGSSRVSTLRSATSVPLITLDGYCESKRIERIDAVKMDVEGFELSVLQGFEKTISRMPPLLVAYECDNESCAAHGFSAADVHGFFLDHGYTIEKARGPGTVTRENLHNYRRRHDFIARHS